MASLREKIATLIGENAVTPYRGAQLIHSAYLAEIEKKRLTERNTSMWLPTDYDAGAQAQLDAILEVFDE